MPGGRGIAPPTLTSMDEHYERMRQRALLAMDEYESGELGLDEMRDKLQAAGSALDGAHRDAKVALEDAHWDLYVLMHTSTLDDAERPEAVRAKLDDLRRILARS